MGKIYSLVMISFLLSTTIFSQWNQTNLKGINPNNKNLITDSTEIFPIMLVGFERELENRNSHPAWDKDWGFNIIQTWHGLKFDINDMDNKNLGGKDSVLFMANKNKLFTAFDQVFTGTKNINSKIVMLPDEPIHDGYDIERLLERKNKMVSMVKGTAAKDFIWFQNYSPRPFYVRLDSMGLDTDYSDVFNSKEMYYYDKDSSNMSYDEAFQLVDIIGFDFYPYGINRNSEKPHIMDSSFQTNYINTSVGEFTRILKDNYPEKAVWPYIQDVPFFPFILSEKYPDPGYQYYLNTKILRHLTFSAIINGADGVIFWGHHRYGKPYTLGGEKLHEDEEAHWKNTLEQCYELSQLQSDNFNKILLEDNVKESYNRIENIAYSYKKVKDSDDEYYLFITNSKNEMASVSVDPIENSLFDADGLKVIGVYDNCPQYIGRNTTRLDYRYEDVNPAIRMNGKKLEMNIDALGTNIILLRMN